MPAKETTPSLAKKIPAPHSRAGIVVARVLTWFGIAFFTLFCVASLLGTSRLSTTDPEEVVGYRWDVFPLTLLVFGLFLALCLFVQRRVGWRPNHRTLLNVLTGCVLAGGSLWVLAVRVYPFADSYWVYSIAGHFATGNYNAVGDFYIRQFPYQLGFIFYLEQLFRLFGGDNFILAQLLNVGCVALAYRLLVKTTSLLFGRPRVTLLVTLLLFGCLQPVFYATLVYGSVPGFMLAVAGLRCAAGYMAGGRARWLWGTAALLGLAVLFKNNYLIFAVAVALALLVHFISAKKWAALAGAAGVVAASLLVMLPVYAYYQARAGHAIPGGMPKSLWVAMGLQEGPKAPGWFNNYSYQVFEETGMDPEAADAVARQSIQESLAGFAQNPGHALWFFATKNLAQWNEPSYACLQQSHCLNTHTHTLPAWARSLYEGRLQDVVFEYFNLYHFTVVALALACFLLRRKSLSAPQLVLLLAILGGFAFHTVWEGKAQYIWQYFVLCLPYAAAGLDALLEKAHQKLPGLWVKKNAALK